MYTSCLFIEYSSIAASRGIHCYLWHPNFQYCLHSCPPLDQILIYINPFHTLNFMQEISVRSANLYPILSVACILINIVNIPFPSTTRHCKYPFYCIADFSHILSSFVCVCVCVWEREREREREWSSYYLAKITNYEALRCAILFLSRLPSYDKNQLALSVFTSGIAVHFICKLLCSSILANFHTWTFIHKNFSVFTMNKPTSSVNGKYIFAADAILVFYTAQNIHTA